MRLCGHVTRCSRLTPVMTSQRDSQLSAPTFRGPVITPSHQRHFCGHTRHTPLSHHVTCHEVLTWSSLDPGHRQPLARADRCPADSLTLPRLTSGVTSQPGLRPARAAATYALPSPQPSPPQPSAGQACVWLLPLNELLQC